MSKSHARLLIPTLLLALTCAAAPRAQTNQTAPAVHPKTRQALDYLRRIEPETIEEQIRITEIPAPPFKEQQRAEYFRRRFAELGLRDVRIDGMGNAIGERPGANPNGPTLVLAAHLDTVFDDPVVRVRREGNVIHGMGIADDGRGLTVLLAIARALNEARIETEGTIIFVANVGEEGLGDLRGTRHLFDNELRGRITHFISLDGAGLGITNRAVGSFRYRATFKGPGGHSYGAFGLPNPIHALGRAIEKISRFQVPREPKTTFNVGRIEGGTSVNSIAHTAAMEVDMRSESASELARIDAEYRRAVETALEEENARWPGRQRLTVENRQIGNRPTGEQPADAPIVRAALEADKALGIRSSLDAGSTDSNIPISRGIPAITLDAGGRSRGTHSPEESWDATDSHLGAQRALLTVVNIVGIKR